MGGVGGMPAFNRRGNARCSRCGKLSYRTREEARAAKRILHPGEKMHAYACGQFWHFGHDDVWRDIPPDDLIWSPLPGLARSQMLALARLTIGAPA